jgi:hypothetical protein
MLTHPDEHLDSMASVEGLEGGTYLLPEELLSAFDVFGIDRGIEDPDYHLSHLSFIRPRPPC